MNINKIVLSTVIPFYNEGQNLKKLNQELVEVLKQLKFRSEIIYVDDGSMDDSLSVLKKVLRKIKDKNISVKILKLTQNFGQTPATQAGIDYANGKLISFLDSDLQNDPNDLIKMVDKISEGYDGVFGWRKNRQDPMMKCVTSRIANFLIRLTFNTSLHDVGCSIKVLKRELLQNTYLYGQSHRILPLVILEKGAKTTEVTVNHRGRIYGQSNYGYLRIINLIIDLIRVKFFYSSGRRSIHRPKKTYELKQIWEF